MEVYGYHYPPQYSSDSFPYYLPYTSGFYGMASSGSYRDHGQEYFEMDDEIRPNRSRIRERHRSRSSSGSMSRSGSRTRTRSKSRSHSKSASSHSRSRSRSQFRELGLRDPSFLDAFRVLYLKPHKTKSSTTKYITVQKQQDRIKEALKQDGLGSKKWRFYPRSRTEIDRDAQSLPLTRETSDQRVKIDGNFFRKYKKSRKIDADSPVAKLKRWELLLYKRLGFVHAVDV